MKAITQHKRDPSADEITTKQLFTYDHAERLLKQTFQVNNESVQSLAVHEYDSLGQLKTKKVGGSNTFSNPLQIIDYKYNIRGWMTDINDIDNLNPTSQPQDLFAFKINYNQLTAGANQPADVEKLYNGNISQTFWRTANDNKLRGYAYSYDALNRLNTAYYRKGTTYSNNFNESLSYDKNGNILSLQRWGVPEDHGTVPAIPNMDDLTYTYFPNSNKLRKVSDGVASTKGFNDGVNLSTEYIYDPNANMKEDKNKGITEINYNHLNLPTEIKFSNHQKIAYIYNALGTKIEKTVTNGSNISKTEYLDSFQYIDEELQFFPTSEGYVRKTEGNRRQQFFDYVYNYTDHLGNIRLSYTTDPQSLSNIKILEESNYYPFGLQHGSYNTPARDYRPIGDAREVEMVDRNPYKYKYQGQERQDELNLNWDSFKWRNYDYAIGRFMSVDPLAEKYNYQSPYNFSENRVVDARELEGLEAELINGPDANGLETWKVPVYNYQVTYNNKTGNYESKQVSTSYEPRIKSENKTNTWNGQSELSYTIVDKDNSIKQMSTAENGIEVAGQIQETYSPIDLGEVEATKKVGNRMEEVGSGITTASLAAEGPSLGFSSIGVVIGQTTSLAGSGLNVTADLMRGEKGNALKEGATTISTMVIGNKIDKMTEGIPKTGWIRAGWEQISNVIDNVINN